MKLLKKILLKWLSVLAVLAVTYLVFENSGMTIGVVSTNAILLLLGIVSWEIFRREPTRKNKAIFLNFAVYFLSSVFYFIYPFFGASIFPGDPYPGFYFYQYVLCGLVVFLLSFSLVFVVFDSLFNDWTLPRKYLFTLLLVMGVFAYYYEPFIMNANYIYTTEDVVDFKSIETTLDNLIKDGKQSGVDDIAAVLTLNAWKDGKPVGSLFPEENKARISKLLPYLVDENYAMLIFKQLYARVIYVDVFSLIFIFVFFGFQYRKDPPQGAYIEKILFLFLPLCSLEILHYYAYISLSDYSTYLGLFEVAQYLVIFNLLLLLIFFSLRLSFITSIKGEFYERELVLDSEHISRWRDGIDNLVVRHFLNPQTIHGRLFAPRESRSRT